MNFKIVLAAVVGVALLAGAETVTNEVGKVVAVRTDGGEWTFTSPAASNAVAKVAGAVATNVVREANGGVWDATLEVWWSPRMDNGRLTYCATTNVNLNAEN